MFIWYFKGRMAIWEAVTIEGAFKPSAHYVIILIDCMVFLIPFLCCKDVGVISFFPCIKTLEFCAYRLLYFGL